MPFAVYLLLLRISTWMMAFFKSLCSIWATDTHIIYRLTTLFYFFLLVYQAPQLYLAPFVSNIALVVGEWGICHTVISSLVAGKIEIFSRHSRLYKVMA